MYLIFLTARSTKEEIAVGLDAGADDYVTKPFDPPSCGRGSKSASASCTSSAR